MDPFKYTTIGHQGLCYCNPVGAAAVEGLLSRLELTPDDQVLDVGCGKAAMLIWLIEHFGARGVGVDRNAAFLAEARATAAARIPSDRLELLESDFADLSFVPGRFAVALCVGSTHACGGYRAALRELTRSVRPGGRLLIGEGYWKREPDERYLEAIGATRDEMGSRAELRAQARDSGLDELAAVETSAAEWDAYEGSYARSLERFVAEHPADHDAEEIGARIRRWREAYERWGRDTMGFALYLLEAP